jgi:arylsulfatase A-like enzyme
LNTRGKQKAEENMMKSMKNIPAYPTASIDRRLTPAIFVMLILMFTACKNHRPEDNLPSPNILMIFVDDLRPELACYGTPVIRTPHIDRLASSGYIFNHHYVQSAICGPSRSSLLTGKVSQQWDPWAELREAGDEPPAPVALPHLFKKNGYLTIGIGKISHEPGGVMDEAQRIAQIPFSWDTTFTAVGKWDTPWRAFFAYSNGDAHNTAMKIGMETPHIPYEAGDVDDEGYPDGLNALEAIRQLQNLKEQHRPFFMALGFYKPHLPFNAPKKYWDLYDRDEIPMAENNFIPRNADSRYCINNSPEVTTHYPWPDGPGNVSPESARILKHGYYAAVSYMDALIGKVLDELERLDLSKNTIVVLWSDHGWHLGEHTMFGKMSNFEIATRSPLIIRVPQISTDHQQVDQLTESIDLYPTLAELCGLAYPDDLDGESLVDILRNPGMEGQRFARSFYYRNRALGTSIRTERYRIVRWATETDSTLTVELYDHQTDPHENINIASEQIEITDSLLNLLKTVKFMDEDMPFQTGWE